MRGIWRTAAATALLLGLLSQARATTDPTADITDLYAWMSPDRARVNLVMNVFPKAGATAAFSDRVQYVFHLTAQDRYRGTAGPEYKIICTFNAQQVAQCWAGQDAYATGVAQNPQGLQSADGRLRVFAGPRDDPAFFNLAGFKAAADFVHANTFGGAHLELLADASGCPQLGSAAATLRSTLASNGMGGAAADSYQGDNVLAIVVSIDRGLVEHGGPIVSVWASTHRAP